MSSIDDLYYKSQRDYGRKLYRGSDDDDYRTLMRKKTVFMYDEAFKQAWSEFEKPYWADDYDEMETFLWNPPGFTPLDQPDPWDWPTVPSNPQDPGDPFGWPSLTVFWCGVSGCFCENDTREAMVNCSHEITGISMAFERLAAKDFSISADIMGSSARLSITAGDDPPGAVEINVAMKAGSVKGSHDSIMITSCSDCEDCDNTDDVAWDDESNETTIDAGDHVNLSVVDGVGPFDWTLLNDVGGKAHMSRVTTVGRTNTLYVNWDACGTVTIQVKDACDDTTVGGVMITDNGKWTNCDHHREIEGIQCRCACGPCHLEVNRMVGPGMYFHVNCGYVGCGTAEDPCASSLYGCILGPKTCYDNYGYAYSFPCLDSGCGAYPFKLSAWSYWYYDFWECN